MIARLIAVAALGVVASLSCLPQTAIAQSGVEQNSNVVGRTPPGYYRGIPGMQDNEPSCAINPILPRNIVCAWNASGGSDDLIGDTWLRFSESLDGGRTFFNRYLNGSNLNPSTSVGQEFGADPVMVCWPGGCGTVMIASTRAEKGGLGGGIYLQLMADVNVETGFRKAFKVNLDQVYRSTGSHFADKPHAIYMLDEANPGTIDVSIPVEMPDGTIEQFQAAWPKARIVVVFALFNPSKTDIEILSTYSDDYGTSWSNPKQIAVTSGRDQGVSLAAIGDTIFYGFRRFANGNEPDAMMGVVSTNAGRTVGKPFVIADNVCIYDSPTLPGTAGSSAAASRTNDFPWVSQDGSNFVMVYSERRQSPGGGCLTNPNAPSDARIKAVVGTADGNTWSAPVEVAPNVAHGFQFMPVVDCALGICQVAWWDSRRDSARTIDFLSGSPDGFAQSALSAFVNLPVLADFNFGLQGYPQVMQFRRTADMFTKKVRIRNGRLDTSDAETIASRYRLGLYDGVLIEREANPFNVKAYKSNTVPFMGDYSSMTSVKHRLVFDPANPDAPPFWAENAGPNPANPDEQPLFWLAWTDSRNMRGQIYASAILEPLPYTRTPSPSATAQRQQEAGDGDAFMENAAPVTMTAEPVDDANPAAGYCSPLNNPGSGELFVAINNRVKDADIYGALIENRASAWVLNPTKTLGSIQRTYTLVVENENDSSRKFRLEIANQPVGYPGLARASWKQLPWDTNDPAFATTAPTTETEADVGPQSSVSLALFVVSKEPVNPVVVDIFDADAGTLINSVTVNGAIESGALRNPDGTINTEELHNPVVFAPDLFNPDHYNPDHYNPDQFNPDQYNPDQFNPDLFNPDLFNPDQFNPDQFNPDQFNPDQYNPDQFNPDLFNPDLFNPDQFNPDQFNPDQFNPDQFNSTLTDSDTLHNEEIPDPDLTNVERDAGGTVVKLDVNFGLQNVGNTLTPYVVDFAITDPEVLELIATGQIATQLIVWQNKQIDDVQLCTPRIATENRVIAAVNDPDLSKLTIPTIADNRNGALTYPVVPGDVLQNTLRFIGPRAKMDIVAEALRNDVISYVFASQAANTGENDLGINREQVINDRTPASFAFTTGDTGTLEAEGPGGATLPLDFVTASRNGEPVPVDCSPALGSLIPLDIDNDPAGPTPISCTATTDNGVVSQLDMFVSVLDRQPPVIDPGSYGNIEWEADPAIVGGALVSWTSPTATDANGVDANVEVTCTPPSGSEFPLTPAGSPGTAVECVATDDSLNESAPVSFFVKVVDTQPPVFDGFAPLTFNPPDTHRVLADDSSVFPLIWGPFTVSDADPNLVVDCEPGTAVPGVLPPQYAFRFDFEAGVTTVTCSATDANGTVTVTFDVEIFDETPPVITVLGDSPLRLDATLNPYVDPGATALDNADGDITANIVVDSSNVDLTKGGTYTVTYTVTDSSGHQAQATRTVIVDFRYGTTGIIPTKLSVNSGSANPLYWAWLGLDGQPVDSSGDKQYLSIRNCKTGAVILDLAGDPGASGFRFKDDFYWQFNWDSSAPGGQSYCAAVRNGRTGQVQTSPPIKLR